MKMLKARLIDEAMRAREAAYCPYSGFAVGAALLTKSGKVYLGANIENASYTPTVCAERVAFFKAVSEGERDFEAIAIAGAKRGEEPQGLFPPCGVCRQVMAEFCSGDFKVILADGGEGTVLNLAEILPYGFGKDNLTDK